MVTATELRRTSRTTSAYAAQPLEGVGGIRRCGGISAREVSGGRAAVLLDSLGAHGIALGAISAAGVHERPGRPPSAAGSGELEVRKRSAPLPGRHRVALGGA